MTTMNQALHWTQRIALVRHNLHCASRSGDFTFFKSLQAAGLIEGTNHVATLSATLGDEADSLLAAMDNLNSGLAYIHQDAFQNVYDSLKNCMRSADEDAKEETNVCKSRIYVDTTLQKNMADMAIDKTTSSAIALINQQPAHVQELAANVWITGATIVADSIEITLMQMDSLEHKCEDFIRLEDSWNTVKSSIAFSITALKGVFSLMGDSSNSEQGRTSKTNSVASLGGNWMRKLSTTFGTSSGLASGASSRTSSVSSQGANHNFPQYRTPQYYRFSVSNGCPTSIPEKPTFFEQHKLSMIPPTPAAEDDEHDPFDTSVAPPVISDLERVRMTPVSNFPGGYNHSRLSQVVS